jgi:60 kDa SS-A/Ro ribonucleoprotein
MKYAKLFNKKMTPQAQPIVGAGQVANSAGGYTWAVDRWMQLDRFLILGSEGGTYYVGEQKLTQDNAKNVLSAIESDGRKVVARIVEVSESGRAPKNDPAIFALALAASFGDDETRKAALEAMPRVCRTGTHLFAFAEACDGLRGWGRGLRRAIGRWYNDKPAEALEHQLVKYGQRGGWSHRDLLRLAHPQPSSDEHKALYAWVVGGEAPGEPLTLAQAADSLKGMKPADAAKVIVDYKVPREVVPTELLTKPDVWEALLQNMPMTAMIRNLATMTRVGLLTSSSEATRRVLAEVGNVERLKRARVHPLSLLMAHSTYAAGKGLRGSGTWLPVPRIVDALESAFYKAFAHVEPTGKRYLLGLDVSASMSCGQIGGTPLSPAEGAAAMAMTTLRTEPMCDIMGFAHTFRSLGISPAMRLKDVLKRTTNRTFGGTDCALPMLYAMQHKLKVDVFVVYTDNETWYGGIHPAQALQEYRQRMGLDAKLIVVGMLANNFSIADPGDTGMLDVVGFDSTVPQVMSEFVR